MKIRQDLIIFEPDDIVEFVRQRLRLAGIFTPAAGMQIVVEQPFAEGAKVHNEVPALHVLLSTTGQTANKDTDR